VNTEASGKRDSASGKLAEGGVTYGNGKMEISLPKIPEIKPKKVSISAKKKAKAGK
jgi:hypothetical protein